MNEQIPYNDNQWDDVPLPDGDAAWQKMELLLEKKKKRRFAWWFWPTAITLIAGLLIGGGLWIYGNNHHEHASNNKTITVGKNNTITTNRQTTSVNTGGQRVTAGDKKDSITIASPTDTKEQATIIVREEDKSSDSLYKEVSKNVPSQHYLKKGPTLVKKKVGPGRHQDAAVKEDDIIERSILIQSNSGNKQKPKAKTDSSSIQKDTAFIKDSAKALPITPAASDSTIKKAKKKQTPVLSAGIGVQQYILLPNQQASPYNYNGTRNFLIDHIPLLYVRWQHNKWHVQADVAYAAPQPVRKFFFSETTQVDSAANTSHTERFAVQKLYYHQLAITVNRAILPHWSVGVGGIYNLLAGSVKSKETTDKKLSTGEETTVEKIEAVKGSRDSLLVRNKSIVGILLQTDYQWKRFTIGLRYIKSLQPYISYYTAIDERREKNQSLQATLRFQLWKGK